MSEKTSNFVFPKWPGTGEIKILIVEESRKPGKPWGPPGGRQEPNETDIECAERETLEETGLVVRAGKRFIERKSRNGFAAEILDGGLTPSASHQRLDWVVRGELEEMHAAGRLRGQWVLGFAKAFVELESGLAVPEPVGAQTDSGLVAIEAPVPALAGVG